MDDFTDWSFIVTDVDEVKSIITGEFQKMGSRSLYRTSYCVKVSSDFKKVICPLLNTNGTSMVKEIERRIRLNRLKILLGEWLDLD